jgi:hypothetical protein
MKITTVSILLALMLLTACASARRADEENKAMLARYSAYTGEPVPQVNSYTHFDSWTPIDNEHVIIHTNVNEAYLLTLAPPCIDLPFATRLGVKTRFSHRIESGFDSIRVGRENCRILEIRPLNYKQMQADLSEERKQRG